MAMQISGVTIQGGMNILPAGGSSPSPTPSGDGYVSGGRNVPTDAIISTIQSFSFSSFNRILQKIFQIDFL